MIIDYLPRRYYEPRGLEMRGCHPRDIVEQVVDICRYQTKPLVITRELLDQACRNYFLEEQKGATAAARGPWRSSKAASVLSSGRKQPRHGPTTARTARSRNGCPEPAVAVPSGFADD